MDDKIQKAFSIANYMATLSNQKRILLEEYSQKLVYYINGATFKISQELITFTKSIIDVGYTSDVPFIDSNNLPIVISDVQQFFDDIISIYFEATNEYSVKYSEIKNKRKVEDIVNL